MKNFWLLTFDFPSSEGLGVGDFRAAALEAFIEQARAYDMISEESWGETLKTFQTGQLTHPVPVIRAREIERWASTAQYHNLLMGDRNITGKSNTSGKWRNW